MPAVAFSTSVCDGSCGNPPSVAASWSSDVIANNKGVVRLGDGFTVHPNGVHPGRVVAMGSATVFANSRNLARISDPISCGANIATGSSNVFSG